MGKRKTDMVEKAWAHLDSEQKGEISAEQVAAAKQEGADVFSGMEKVTVDDFLLHYRELS